MKESLDVVFELKTLILLLKSIIIPFFLSISTFPIELPTYLPPPEFLQRFRILASTEENHRNHQDYHAKTQTESDTARAALSADYEGLGSRTTSPRQLGPRGTGRSTSVSTSTSTTPSRTQSRMNSRTASRTQSRSNSPISGSRKFLKEGKDISSTTSSTTVSPRDRDRERDRDRSRALSTRTSLRLLEKEKEKEIEREYEKEMEKETDKLEKEPDKDHLKRETPVVTESSKAEEPFEGVAIQGTCENSDSMSYS